MGAHRHASKATETAGCLQGRAEVAEPPAKALERIRISSATVGTVARRQFVLLAAAKQMQGEVLQLHHTCSQSWYKCQSILLLWLA